MVLGGPLLTLVSKGQRPRPNFESLNMLLRGYLFRSIWSSLFSYSWFSLSSPRPTTTLTSLWYYLIFFLGGGGFDRLRFCAIHTHAIALGTGGGKIFRTCRVAVVIPTDCPKSVRVRCVIEVFGSVFMLSHCFLNYSMGEGLLS